MAFNGKPVNNLKILAMMVEACDEEFLKFDLEYEQVLSLSDTHTHTHTLSVLPSLLCAAGVRT